MTEREMLHAKLVQSLLGHADGPPVLDLVEGLYSKARALVDLLDDAERNHGSLVGPKTLRGVNELRLELSRWK